MSAPESEDGFTHTVVRLHTSLLRRIDAHAERVRARVPGVEVSRAATIRTLLIQALETAEAVAAPHRRPPRADDTDPAHKAK